MKNKIKIAVSIALFVIVGLGLVLWRFDASSPDFWKGFVTGSSSVAIVFWFVSLVVNLFKCWKQNTPFHKNNMFLSVGMLALFCGIMMSRYMDGPKTVHMLVMALFLISIVSNMLYAVNYRKMKDGC